MEKTFVLDTSFFCYDKPVILIKSVILNFHLQQQWLNCKNKTLLTPFPKTVKMYHY